MFKFSPKNNPTVPYVSVVLLALRELLGKPTHGSSVLAVSSVGAVVLCLLSLSRTMYMLRAPRCGPPRCLSGTPSKDSGLREYKYPSRQLDLFLQNSFAYPFRTTKSEETTLMFSSPFLRCKYRKHHTLWDLCPHLRTIELSASSSPVVLSRGRNNLKEWLCCGYLSKLFSAEIMVSPHYSGPEKDLTSLLCLFHSHTVFKIITLRMWPGTKSISISSVATLSLRQVLSILF